MSGQETAVIDGMNEFVSSLLADEKLANKSQVRATVGMFDSAGWGGTDEPILRFKFQDKPLERVQELTLADYNPRGGTPLNDALSQTIEMMQSVSKSEDKVMIVVMTDGMENSSQTPSDQIRLMIESREEAGWAFIYLGADLDAWSGSRDLGLAKHGSAFNVSKGRQGVSSTMRSAASAVSLYAGSSKQEYLAAMDTASKTTGATIAQDEVVDFRSFAAKEKESD